MGGPLRVHTKRTELLLNVALRDWECRMPLQLLRAATPINAKCFTVTRWTASAEKGVLVHFVVQRHKRIGVFLQNSPEVSFCEQGGRKL